MWDALGGAAGGDGALEDYLFLAREAVGMQYLAATRAEDLEPGAPAHGFLAVMLCETLPRLLPATPASDRARLLAQAWNAGEKLVGKPVWLDRYFAARLPELADLRQFEPFLARIASEGLDDLPASKWSGGVTISVLDTGASDRAFLPGEMHLATPSVVCVHDRRREGRHVAVLLRRAKPLCLGVTPCLGREAGAMVSAPGPFMARALEAAKLPEALATLSAPAGFAVFSTPLSQRLWVAESER